MKSQFSYSKGTSEFPNVATPPLSYSNFTEISASSDFSDATLMSGSTAQTQEKPSPNCSVNPFFFGKPLLEGLSEARAHFEANLSSKLNSPPDFPGDSAQQHSNRNSSFKCKRFDFSAVSGLASFSGSLSGLSSFPVAKEIPSVISTPIPPLVSTLLSSPGDALASNERNPSRRAPLGGQRMKRRRQKTQRALKNRNGIEMAVFDACPGSRLNEQQVAHIEAALVKELDSIRDVEAQPKFLKSFFDHGVFWMTCANVSTKQWLLKSVRKINKFFNEFNLKVVEARIPKRPIVYIDLVDLDKPAEVLHRLKGQNSGLNTSRWVVLNRKVSETGQRVTFSIDLDSFEFLKAQKFLASWKLKAITFRVPNKQGKDLAGKSVKKLSPKSQRRQRF